MLALRWLHPAMFGALVLYVVLLAVGPAGVPPWVTDWLLAAAVYGAAVLCLLLRGARHHGERAWTTPMALAVCAFALGGSFYFAEQGTGATINPVVTAMMLAVYPCLLVGLLLALRAHVRRVRLIVALDGIAAALAGAAVVACVVAPLAQRDWQGSMTAAVALCYCLGDVLLVGVAFGALGLVGRRDGRAFLLWALAITAYSVGDIGYLYRLTVDTFSPGTWWDGWWALGMCLLALGADRVRPRRAYRLPGAASLAVVALASVAAVSVLAVAPAWSDNPLPSVLALVAVTASGIRLLLAFRQLRELTEVRELALTDELTGAANRRALYAELDRLLPTLPADQTDPGVEPFALALVDLDHFKEVNDSHGHGAGDELLRAVVARFEQALTGLATRHLLVRLGGDEFAVVLHDVRSGDAALACGAALQASLLEPVRLEAVVLHVQASIGVAVAPEHARTRGDMLFAADAAMYAAKTSGEPVCLYSPADDGDRRRRLETAEDLYAALERGELTVEYQPLMTAAGELVAGEALVRWDHPTRGRLGPADFLEVAERYRLTPSIAARVLDVVLRDLHRWRVARPDLRISVNVSASDLRDEGLVGIVANALLEHDVPPGALTIEITETAMMRDPATAQTVMCGLADLGVQLAVDDYGTGYSSLEYLLTLPIDEIKLDRAFSTHLVDELRAVAIVRSTVDLTHALGLRMVAEGVEDAQTLAILEDLGCDLVQGWHLGRPMSAVAFERTMAGHAPARPDTAEARRARGLPA